MSRIDNDQDWPERRKDIADRRVRTSLAFAATDPKDVFGSLRHEGPLRTLEEMYAAIGMEVERRQRLNRY